MVTPRTGGGKGVQGRLDRLRVAFDDDRAVANAGLVLTATLAERLRIEALADQMIDLGCRPGAYRPGRKLVSLVHSMVAGGTRSMTPTSFAPAPRPRCSATG